MKRILSLLAVFALTATQAHATCRGSNLYKTTPDSFKKSVETRLAKTPNAQGIYWEVSKKGKTSWIIGTIHITDKRVSTPPAFFRQKIQNARVFQMEATPQTLVQVLPILLKELSKRKPGKQKNWWAKLTPAEQKILLKEARAKKFDVKRLKAGNPNTFGGLIRRPKCATTQNTFLDMNLYGVARKAGVPVQALDKPIDIANSLIKRRTDDDEVFEVIRLELQRLHLRPHYVETMVQMYKTQQAEKFMIFESAARKAYVPKRYNRAMDRFLRADLLDGRNKKWMSKMVAEMNKGNVVTAVGAAHLAGRNGVLNLLKSRGFTIKRLKL